MMKRRRPYGGVIKPIMMLTTTTTPKCTRSMPSAWAVGMKTGTMIRRIAVPSSTQPSRSRSTLTSIRKPIGDRSQPARMPFIVSGMFSMVTT